ncbi:cholesterol transporter ABCA5-like [Ylistrum balloti]|uniref:cholesterol transporter ABCA5-like n=1 Tax=Ylistrum balloti TaxID=509963 RepID=UPI002905A5DC|nr:cholesterol transporter ABCA5-like [Ylistrum balloti]
MQVSFGGQFKALLKKNILLKKRAKKQFLMELFYPIYFAAILSVIKLTTKTDTLSSISFMKARTLDNNTLQYPDTFQGKNILVSPDTAEIRTIANDSVAILQQMLNLPSLPTLLYYSDQNSMDTAYTAHSSNISAGLLFYYDGKTNTSYAIRTPHDNAADTTSWIRQQDQCRNGDGQDTTNCDANKYLNSGFCLIQAAVDAAIIRIQTGDSSFPVPEISVQMMPKPSYTPDTSYLQTISSIYFVIAYSPFVSYLTTNLVAEKEKKIKESMKMMGLRDSAFWLSWGLVYLVVIAISTAVITVLMIATSFFANSNAFLFFLILFFYGLSIITFAYMLTPFFSKAQTAGGLASLMSIIFSCLYLAVSQTRTMLPSGAVVYSISPGVRWLLCILSPVAVALAIDQAIFLDKPLNGGMNFSTINDGEFPLYAPMVMLLVDTIVYFFLAVYLDNVLPGEYGARQKPWYFLMPSYWCSKGDDDLQLLSRVEYGEDNEEFVESVPEDLGDKTAVRILDIHKEFKSKETKEMIPAVDGLSLDIYEGQVTCLLGHNGAGKTTLVNMLTGLMPPTKGTASILGLNIANGLDMQKIRSMTGVCPQHNIIFDDMSCVEHIHLYGAIKGVPDHLLQSETETSLKNVDLYKERNTFAKNLSGGQKRKLCVAIALIGNPKIIFLDEPTAGMDPYSRRHLWSVLKEKKEGRVILLTTHFMDEADILADRKAIISKGRLRCCGSSLFLKSKFGIGYHLNMVVDPGCDVDQVTQLVKNCVAGGELQRTHGKELAYTLPLQELQNFAVLFSTLEKPNTSLSTMADSLGIKNYGVSMTSLEEVFLKLEEDDSSFDLKDITMSPSKKSYGTMQNFDKHTNTEAMTMDTAMSTSCVDRSKLRSQQFWALCKVRFFRLLRDPGAVIFALIFPAIFVLAGMLVNKYVQSPSTDTTPVPLYINNAITQYARETSAAAGTPTLAVNNVVGSADSIAFMNTISSAFFTETFANVSDLLPGYHQMGVQLDKYTVTGSMITQGFTAIYNDSAIHSMPAAISLMTSKLQSTLNLTTLLSVVNLPWPKGASERTYDQGAFSSTILVAMAFVTVPPSFAVQLVKDRQFKIRSQMRVTGVTFGMYWATTFFVDILQYLIPATLSIIFALAFQPASLTYSGAVLAMFLLFICFVPGNTLFAYVISYLFTKFESAQAAGVTMFFFISFIPYIIVSLLDMLLRNNVASILHYIFLAIDPPYAVFGGFYYIDRVYRVHLYSGNPNADIPVSAYFEPEFIMSFVMPLIHCVLGFFLLRMLDIKNTGGDVRDALPCLKKQRNSQVIPHKNDDAIDDEDEDVTSERERVKSIKFNRENVAAYVENLRKEFKKDDSGGCFKRKTKKEKIKAVVRNTTYAVDTGEILGLLGPNGAGKSTTLNMMIAEVGPTKGEVVIGGYDIHSCMSEAFEGLGFCPQHDALWDVITLKEHIECYANLRGVPKEKISPLANFFIDNMKLDEHKNKQSKKLSGGTKRKLSYILSILGRPKIVLLDEPSTGMDPQSKRFLWDTISSCFEGSERGAILTTHYMEEADALCSRVAIMVNGKLQCIGETQRLKNRYGSGYMLEVKLRLSGDLEARMEALEDDMKNLFPDAVCQEKFAERAQYSIPKANVKSLATTFTALEQAKAKHSLEEYSFSQSTLEQVFLQFAKQQLDENASEEPEANGSVPEVLVGTTGVQNSNNSNMTYFETQQDMAVSSM